MSRFVARLAVAVLVAAAAGLGVPGPAGAATCGSAKGVTVVVDFHQLGGGVTAACDTNGAGRTGDVQMKDVGHTLTYVQRQPGFVCRVDGRPATDPCVNTPPSDAYWSLWWSDGESGTWTYSAAGIASLEVPAGGYVALSWQQGVDRARPGVSPTPHVTQASSSPSTNPTSTPSSTGPGQPSASSTAVGPSTSSSATSTPAKGGQGTQHVDPSMGGTARGKASHGPDRTQAGEPLQQVANDSPDDTSGSGAPGWVAPLAIALLFVGAGTIALVRRKSSGGT